jgi:hypothetical protein
MCVMCSSSSDPGQLSSYYIALHTGEDYDVENYDDAAGRLMNLLSTVLSDREALTRLVGTPLYKSQAEIEASMESVDGSRELIAACVLDMWAGKKVKFDKAKFSKMVKLNELNAWPDMKVAKKHVPQHEIKEGQ